MAVARTKRHTSKAGQAIKTYRQSHGITQKQLAIELGVEARTLRMYENGERALDNITDLQRIAALLSINPEELGLAATKTAIHTPTQIYEAIEHIWSLIPQGRLVEAHTSIDTLLQNISRAPSSEDPQFISACASAHNIAGYTKSIVNKAAEAERAIQHFQEMARLGSTLNDQTLFMLALSQHGEMLRRQNKLQKSIVYLENAATNAPLAHPMIQGNNARLLARAYLSNEDINGFEKQIQHAETLAQTLEPVSSNTLTFFCPGMVYDEYGRGYGRMGKLEKSLSYLEQAETLLPTNNLWDMMLKASRAEALIYNGVIAEGMQFAIEVAHLAHMYGHQRILERLYRLQCYMDDRSLLMNRASRSLNDILHGQSEP